MRTGIDIDRLIGELTLDKGQVAEALKTNKRAQQRIQHGATDSLDYAALGYTIHNLYGIIENACLRISKFFENGLPKDAWHRELLDRMLLDIPNVRPAFFTRPDYELIDELRAFRHLFRNLYNRELDPERLMIIQNRVPRAVSAFGASVDRYFDFLAALKRELR